MYLQISKPAHKLKPNFIPENETIILELHYVAVACERRIEDEGLKDN